jgi:hypothetical protein
MILSLFVQICSNLENCAITNPLTVKADVG